MRLAAVAVGTALLAPLVAHGLLPADAGEFQLVARHLGVAHPPGYPAYTLAAHAFGRLVAAVGWAPAPGGDPWAFGVNLLSAALAAATLVVVFDLVRRITGSPAAGVLGAVALGAAPTFLAQATTANIRMPGALLTALALERTARWLYPDAEPAGGGASGRQPVDRDLVALALVLALAAAHHGSLAFLALPVAALVLARRPAALRDARTLAAAAGAVALAALPLAYLPLRDRAGAVLAPGNLTTARGLLEHATAYGFRGDLLYFDDAAALLDRLAVLADILRLQLGPWLLAAAGLGALWLAARRPAAAVLLAASAALIAALAITYRAPQTVEYLLPAYVALAALAGAAGGAVAELGRGRPRIAAAATLAAALAVGVAARERPAAVRAAHPILGPAVSVLEPGCLPPDGTVLASWHFAPPLWYAALDRAPRPAETVRDVFPEGAEPSGQTWQRRLAALEGPVVVTNRPAEIVRAEPLWPVPGSPFFATEPLDCAAAPAETVGADFGGLVRLETLRLTAEPGADPTVELAFRALAPVSERLTIVAQLLDPATGAVWGQVDHGHDAAHWNDPRGLVDRATLVPFRGARPAPLELTVGIYRTGPSGPVRLPTDGAPARTVATLGAAELGPATGAPPAGAVPFGRAMTLLASNVRRAGDEVIVDLTWRADAARFSDLTVSAQVHGAGWHAQHDGTPALGALPTLKWLPGFVVHDRHRVALPQATPGDAPFRVTVGVYDAFTFEPLPVTDAERVRRGQGQAAEIFATP